MRVFDGPNEWCIHVSYILFTSDFITIECPFLQVDYHGILVLITMELFFCDNVLSSDVHNSPIVEIHLIFIIYVIS